MSDDDKIFSVIMGFVALLGVIAISGMFLESRGISKVAQACAQAGKTFEKQGSNYSCK